MCLEEELEKVFEKSFLQDLKRLTDETDDRFTVVFAKFRWVEFVESPQVWKNDEQCIPLAKTGAMFHAGYVDDINNSSGLYLFF